MVGLINVIRKSDNYGYSFCAVEFISVAPILVNKLSTFSVSRKIFRVFVWEVNSLRYHFIIVYFFIVFHLSSLAAEISLCLMKEIKKNTKRECSEQCFANSWLFLPFSSLFPVSGCFLYGIFITCRLAAILGKFGSFYVFQEANESVESRIEKIIPTSLYLFFRKRKKRRKKTIIIRNFSCNLCICRYM